MQEKYGLIRHGIWMSLSTVLRLASGMLIFIYLARQMGVSAFGSLMTAMAVAGIIAMPCNFGLTMYFLNKGPRCEDKGNALLPKLFGLKVLLLGACLILLWPTAIFLKISLTIALLLLGMHVTESFIELLCVRMRVNGSFEKETGFVSAQALLQLVVMSIIATWFHDIQSIACGFFMSRVLALLVALTMLSSDKQQSLLPEFRGLAPLAREARSFFLDYSSQTALIQMDTVLLGVHSNGAAVGVYQAGMKVVQGLSQAITIMVNVALPKLAKQHASKEITSSTVYTAMIIFSLVGALFAVPLWISANTITTHVFGQAFSGLPQVIEWLAVFIAVRFLAAASGMLLIVMGEQRVRATVMFMAVLVLAATAQFLMPRYGAVGAVLSMISAYTFILVSLSLVVFWRARN